MPLRAPYARGDTDPKVVPSRIPSHGSEGPGHDDHHVPDRPASAGAWGAPDGGARRGRGRRRAAGLARAHRPLRRAHPHVCRSHRLCDADADDVAQLTWLRAVEHIGRLRDPERFGAWVGTTARRECLRVLQGRKRVVPTCDEVRNPLFARARRRGRDRARRRAPRRGAARARRAARPPAHAAAAAALGVASRATRRSARAARDADRQHRADPRPRARAFAQRNPTAPLPAA